GVQTCALPIWVRFRVRDNPFPNRTLRNAPRREEVTATESGCFHSQSGSKQWFGLLTTYAAVPVQALPRSSSDLVLGMCRLIHWRARGLRSRVGFDGVFRLRLQGVGSGWLFGLEEILKIGRASCR